MNVREAAIEGGRAALAAFGLPSQPSLSSVGIKPPSAPGIPKPGSVPSRLGGGGGLSAPSPSPSAAAGGKLAFNVGMGASTTSNGAGAVAGDPADEGRRQRSVIDRTFQANEDNFATSSMPAPGSVAP